MYERMLDKSHEPTEEAFIAYCGASGPLFLSLDSFLREELNAERVMRFPYGNSYGWGMKYTRKKKLVCDIFAEDGACCVMLRLSDKQYASVYDSLSEDARKCIDGRYPCGDGGWIHFRVLSAAHVADVKSLLRAKLSVREAK